MPAHTRAARRAVVIASLLLALLTGLAGLGADAAPWEDYVAAVDAAQAELGTVDAATAFHELFKTYVGFKTISKFSSDEYVPELEGCAAWLVSVLREELGMENAATYKSGWRFPVVVGSSAPFDADKKSVIIYGHYDVQPVDGEWTISEPFEMKRIAIENEVVFTGRGSQDDKGNSFAAIWGLAALHRALDGGLASLPAASAA